MTQGLEIGQFVDYVALAYHEARNVRHLVMGGVLEIGVYRPIISMLRKNRDAAWKELQPIRDEARNAHSARLAEEIFYKKFNLKLRDLVEISDNPNWRGNGYGGNRWAAIDRALIELMKAIDRADQERVDELLGELPRMLHNTGVLGDKLKELDGELS